MVTNMKMKLANFDRQAPWNTSAATGAIMWLLWTLAVRPEWTAVLLLLSPFVLVPLGLGLAAQPEVGPQAPVLRRLAALAPVAAIGGALSFVPRPGLLAALISIPWLVFTAAIALVGVGRVMSRRTLAAPGIGTDAGLMFIVVGGVWLTISRGGLNPLGFHDVIVQLTAVHFHYAGFALPIVAGFTASRLGRSALVSVAVIVGVPLTAAGITAGGWLEWVGATVMALAGVGTATLLLLCGRHSRGTARWLITTAGISLMGGMGLALGWAWSVRFGWNFLRLDDMAATHGSLNALGFGLLGLIGLNLLAPTNEASDEINLHLGRPSAETLRRLLEDAVDQDTTNPVGLLSLPLSAGFSHKTWKRDSEHGDFDAAVEAIRQWRGHEAAGITRWPAQPEITVGETLAMAIPVGPISVGATSRVVQVVDEPNRYGFTYSTLPHHAVDGEESFIVERHDDGRVDITVTAVWRPATIANHVCSPLTRFLQNRAINQYLDGIAAFQGAPAKEVRAL